MHVLGGIRLKGHLCTEEKAEKLAIYDMRSTPAMLPLQQRRLTATRDISRGILPNVSKVNVDANDAEMKGKMATVSDC